MYTRTGYSETLYEKYRLAKCITLAEPHRRELRVPFSKDLTKNLQELAVTDIDNNYPCVRIFLIQT